MTQEALKLALEALEVATTPLAKDRQEVLQAITALEEALAQTQEPVGRFTGKFTVDAHDRMLCEVVCMGAIPTAGAALYTTPPQSTWVGLTDEQLRTEFGKLYPNDIGILELAENNRDFAVEAIGARHHWVAFQAGARVAEAKLKEKNT